MSGGVISAGDHLGPEPLLDVIHVIALVNLADMGDAEALHDAIESPHCPAIPTSLSPASKAMRCRTSGSECTGSPWPAGRWR